MSGAIPFIGPTVEDISDTLLPFFINILPFLSLISLSVI